MQNNPKDTCSFYDCLGFLIDYFQKTATPETVLSGLPVVDDNITMKVFVQAAARAGIKVEIRKIPLTKLLRERLPAIVLMRDHTAVFATEYLAQQKSVRAYYGKGSEANAELSLERLAAGYLGYAMFVSPIDEISLEQQHAEIDKSRHWFRRSIFRSWRVYRDVLFSSFMINVFALASPIFIMNVYDRVVPNHAIETLWVLVSGILIIFAFDLVLRVLRGYFIDTAGRRVDIELSSMLFEHVLGIRMGDRPASVGAFANHLDEFESVRNFITSATVTAFIDLPFVVLFLLVIWFVGGNIVVVPLVAIPLILTYALVLQPFIKAAITRVSHGAAQKNATLVESLVGIETIKLLGAESRQQHKWEQAVEFISRWAIRSRLLSASVVNAAVFLQQLSTIGVVAYGVYLITSGSLSLGGLIAAVILTSRVLAPMAQVANLTTHYHQVTTALKTIDSIMRLPSERQQDKSYLTQPHIRGEIEFDKVTFSYPQQPVPALNNVTLKIAPGEHVGVIGRTGSGKSTLGKLIAGLYADNTGFVRLDGLDVRHIAPSVLRSHIGYVTQDVMLFDGSMRDNISFGGRTVPDEQLIVAAEISGVMSTVRRHPDGFDMHIGERGSGLSGGQRQEVAVARAILRDPPVIILDEPTTSMDNATEAKLKEKLKPYLQGKTLILITHKSSMLDLVDRLIVLEEGRIIANGNKADVIRTLQTLAAPG
ncbi:MAG: type I secretion system permease/ATPase [Gammaproteobacteria bacterium]|nr:type I secretion system permease/ATPase [Gammaproteobacteria bacterium]